MIEIFIKLKKPWEKIRKEKSKRLLKTPTTTTQSNLKATPTECYCG